MATTNTEATWGNLLSVTLNCAITSLTRATTVIDNTLATAENVSSVLNRTTELADQANQLWASDTIAKRSKESQELLASLEAQASNT